MGLGQEAYSDDKDEKDLVALRPAKGEDRLSQFLRDHCSSLLKVCPPSHQTPLVLGLLRRKSRKNVIQLDSLGRKYTTHQNHESRKQLESSA